MGSERAEKADGHPLMDAHQEAHQEAIGSRRRRRRPEAPPSPEGGLTGSMFTRRPP